MGWGQGSAKACASSGWLPLPIPRTSGGSVSTLCVQEMPPQPGWGPCVTRMLVVASYTSGNLRTGFFVEDHGS